MFNILDSQYRAEPKKFEMPKYFDPKNSRSGKTRKSAMASTKKVKKVRLREVNSSMQHHESKDYFGMQMK